MLYSGVSILKPKHFNVKSKLMMPLLLLVSFAPAVWAAQPKNLAAGHVPSVVARGRVTPQGRLAATNRLQLAIGLPLRNQAALARFLNDLYNPASPVFHHYLTPAEFTLRITLL